MSLSINRCVVKSFDVAVLTPRVVECKDITPRHYSSKSTESSLLKLETHDKAATMIAEAEANAKQIRVLAEADRERLRQEVIQTAQAEVYPEAQAKGYQAGLELGQAEAEQLTQSAKQLFQLAQRAVQEEYHKVDGTLLTLAMKIAERLVRSSLAVDPRRLEAIIQALTLLPQDREGWRLHVAPEDARWLQDKQPPCPFVADESLKPGDCFLECQEGIFDARLEAQLDKLEHNLREELEHGGLESIDGPGGTN